MLLITTSKNVKLGLLKLTVHTRGQVVSNDKIWLWQVLRHAPEPRYLQRWNWYAICDPGWRHPPVNNFTLNEGRREGHMIPQVSCNQSNRQCSKYFMSATATMSLLKYFSGWSFYIDGMSWIVPTANYWGLFTCKFCVQTKHVLIARAHSLPTTVIFGHEIILLLSVKVSASAFGWVAADTVEWHCNLTVRFMYRWGLETCL
jgi:hypothetical protein